MRRSLALFSLFSLLAVAASAQAGLPANARAHLGDWTTYSDETGEAQVVVRISETNGVVQGRIIRVLPTQKDKSYKATLKLDGPNQLRVRGYIGIRALGRTQVWRRAN